MTNLLDTLGLGEIKPAVVTQSSVPDNTYLCTVERSDYLVVTKKDELSHSITFRIAEGEYKGKRLPAAWQVLGNAPRKADGSPAATADEVANYNPTMTPDQKSWYKKRLMDILQVPEAEVANHEISELVGKLCVVNVKTENGFQNVKWVNPAPKTATASQPTSMADFAAASVTAAPTTEQPAAPTSAESTPATGEVGF